MKLFLVLTLTTLLGCSSKKSNDIVVLINVESFQHEVESIKKGVSLIDSFEPKVISIGYKFSDEPLKDNSDDNLFDHLEKCRTKVVIRKDIENYPEELEESDELIGKNITRFIPLKEKTGYMNLPEELDLFGTINRFSTWESVNGKIEYSFGVLTAFAFDSLKTANFLRRHPKNNLIEFYNVRKLQIFQLSDIISGKIGEKEIEGKIVVFGLLGPGFTDRFYSGAIKRGNGSFVPDMYAIEFQAHIALQILSE